MPAAWRLAVATVCFGAFMGQLDASITTLAYPALRADFGVSLAAVSWVSLSYLLTLTALLVPVGRLSDAFGRKLFYVYGFGVFTAASAACALAPDLDALVAFRVLQAVGAAMLQANSIALIATSVPRERLRSALGAQAAAQALGLGLGPAVGGLLVDTVGWRWVFGLNAPVGVVALIGGIYLLPRTRARNPGFRVDFAPLHAKRVRFGLLGAAGGYLVLFGPLVLVPVVLDEHGGSTLVSGLVLTALPVGFAIGASLLRWKPLPALALSAGALAALLAVPFQPAFIAPLLGGLGLGLGAYAPSNNAAVMASVSPSESGVVSGLLNISRSLGTFAGVFLVTTAVGLAAHGGGRRLALAGLLAACLITLVVAVVPTPDPFGQDLVGELPTPGGVQSGTLVGRDDQQRVGDLRELPRQEREPGEVGQMHREAAHSQ